MNSTPARGRLGRSASRAGWMAVLLLGPLLLWSGCSGGHGTVLGKAPTGEPTRVLAVRAGDTPPQVTLRGTMIEKCPEAGCWFYLRDATGVIKVDTKSAGFVVVNVPLQAEVTVSGKVVSSDGEVSLDATGLRY